MSNLTFAQYRRKLERLHKNAFPVIVAESINGVAGFAHVQSIRNIRDRFVLRNRYTERSVRFMKASPKSDWLRINAITGSTQPYMALQESGGYRKPATGATTPIARLEARGGNPRSVVRSRNRAGQLGRNQFVGKPSGSMPLGVWQRKRGKKLALVRDISRPSIRIDPRHWHRDAVRRYARREVMQAEFNRQASLALRELARGRA